MKKILTAALLVIAFAVTSFAAGGNKGSYALPKNFSSQLSNIQWSLDENGIKATFVSNNVKTENLYNKEGEFIGTYRPTTFEALPANVKEAFTEKYEGYTIKQVKSLEGVQETAYYVSAENEKGIVTVKMDNNGSTLIEKNSK